MIIINTITTNAPSIQSNLPPSILRPPMDLVTDEGSTVTFDVVAGGAMPFSYQWRRGMMNLPGETNAVLQLANVLTKMSYGGSIAAVGLAGGNKLDTTVIPFLLRGVNLLGIDSVMRPYADRAAAWQRLVQDLPLDKLEAMIQPATLADLPKLGKAILKGQVKGRVVVEVG